MLYSIKEAARMLGVSRESLRSWERRNLIPKPLRILNNSRRYSDEDIKAIQAYLIKMKK